MSTLEESRNQVREILGPQYLSFRVGKFHYSDDLASSTAELRCDLLSGHSEDPRSLEGRGVGIIDALFGAVRSTMAKTHPSLNSLTIVGFSVDGRMDTKVSQSGSDAIAHAVLSVESSEGRRFEFEAESRSVSAASVQVTLAACEFFINSERAFKKLHRLLKNARERRRSDLEEMIVSQMADLVKITSYSEVIEDFRRKHLG